MARSNIDLEQTRITIIGTGWWSTYAHIPALQANPNAYLVALCDRDEQKLRRAAETYGIERTYTDHRAMLAQEHPDGVVIATPHATHYALAADCLDAGCHLLIEKPMTLHAADACDLVRRARDRERTITVGYTSNFHPHAARARDIMQRGVLGKPQFVVGTMVSRVVDFLRGERPSGMDDLFPVHGPGTVYKEPELSGGGQGHLQLTHLVGLLAYVSGLRAQRVSAFMQNHGLALDLVDAITVQFEGGALATIGGSGNAVLHRLALEVHCEHGGLVLDISQGTLVVHGPDGIKEIYGPPDPPFAGHPVPSQQFVASVLGRPSDQGSGEVGWRAVEILDAAYRSAGQNGAPIAVASLYE